MSAKQLPYMGSKIRRRHDEHFALRPGISGRRKRAQVPQPRYELTWFARAILWVARRFGL